MDLQQSQLKELSLWLSTMEEKITQYGPVGPTLDAIKLQVAQHKVRVKVVDIHVSYYKEYHTVWSGRSHSRGYQTTGRTA